ncbi:MAG TPA: ATP-binding protein [Actinomycetota bacterium]
MRVVVETLRWITTFVYLGAAVVALRMRFRTRGANAPATWLAAAFGSLGLILISGFFLPKPPYSAGWLWGAKLLVVVLISFPYLLLRFSSSLGIGDRGPARVAAAATAMIAICTIGLPEFVAQDAAKPAWYGPFVVAFVVTWFAISIAAARRLWRAGRGQAPVVARRLRMMSVGSALIAAAVLGSLFSTGTAAQPQAARVVNSILSVGAGLMFLLAFTAPRWLRAYWRRAEEQATRDAAATCIRAGSVAELCDTLLPHLRRVLGGTGAVLAAPDGRVLGSVGLAPADAERIAAAAGDEEPDPAVLSTAIRHGRLAVALSLRAPFAGAEEASLLASFGDFADAALERLSLLERGERMRAEFIAMLSHDMRAPLTAARGMIETLASEWDKLDGALRQQMLERASSNGVKLGAMIEQMLEHAQLDAGQVESLIERINVGRAVADVVGNLGVLIEGHRVVTDVNPNLHAIADARALERILGNLVVNAAKYSPAGTTITIAATGRGEMVAISVADEGPGIAPDDRARIFDSFYRGSRTNGQSGLGLGLAIVRRLAELQDGRVEIADRPFGSTFTVLLPGGADRVIARAADRVAG